MKKMQNQKKKNKLSIPYWADEPNSIPLPKQLDLHQADYRYRMMSGAVRGGKTLWGCQEGIKLSFKWNGNRGAIIRETLTTLKRTTQDTFFKIFGCTSDNIKEHPLVKSWNKQEQHLVFINGSDIYFMGADNLTVLKSVGSGWIFADEGVEIRNSVLKFIRSRLSIKLKYPDYKQYFFTATNPGSEDHVLYKWFIKIPETPAEIEDRKRFYCGYTTTYENKYLPKDFIIEVDSWKNDPEFHNRFALGKWGRFKGLVYKEYDENIHLIVESNYDKWMNKIIERGEIYCGTDWGFTNPAVILFFGITGDGDIIQFDEIYETGKTNPELRLLHSHRIERNKVIMRTNYADPEEPSDIKEFRDNGIFTLKANNDIEAGIRKVKEYLRLSSDGAPKYRIFERCIKTRKEFGLYRRPDEDDISDKKNIPELPIDKDNHAMGGLRYFLMTHLSSTAKLEDYTKVGSDIDFEDMSPVKKEKYKRMLARHKENNNE